MLHCPEGFTPLAVAATQPPPARRMLPWNTYGDTQGLVRTFIQPSSIECNFMSQRTTKVSDRSQPPMTLDPPVTHSAGSGSLHRLVRHHLDYDGLVLDRQRKPLPQPMEILFCILIDRTLSHDDKSARFLGPRPEPVLQ